MSAKRSNPDTKLASARSERRSTPERSYAPDRRRNFVWSPVSADPSSEKGVIQRDDLIGRKVDHSHRLHRYRMVGKMPYKSTIPWRYEVRSCIKPEFWFQIPMNEKRVGIGLLLLDEDEDRAVVATASSLVSRNASVVAILLESSFFAPYADSIRVRLNMPVFDFNTLIQDLHDGTLPS